MAKLTRVALIGGADAIRSARRLSLEANTNFQVVYDSDGFNFSPEQLLEVTFDVAVVDHRLSNLSAFDFIIASHALARVGSTEIGRILISSPFSDDELRLKAIEAGAVDCVFVAESLDVFLDKVAKSSDKDADFGIREILKNFSELTESAEMFTLASVAIDTLDAKEQLVIKNFYELKSDAQIAQVAQVPKLKVRNTIAKLQALMMLSTRSQLLLKLHRLNGLSL